MTKKKKKLKPIPKDAVFKDIRPELAKGKFEMPKFDKVTNIDFSKSKVTGLKEHWEARKKWQAKMKKKYGKRFGVD